ncbi:MAG: helix-turn-helix domain-containing protein [Synechococcus sp. SB0666_bin_14]|nr:helix-turn-helix domain-containing protein [Synechococcus sp. SB0666_bin_14]MYG46554.1 helix-turn-helix domain-containing protein [Synechococcus sp. SB0675_bin_6]MYJ60602.1 helix-turn-helix domain-containing protein [Synechococcus sp. SB0672_bin_6]MYK90642.1 helix-turn-helix domain-containing protein [Synechococcus sp. SB0669_bin_8]
MRFPEGLELKTYGQQLLAGRQAKGWSQKQLSKKLFLPIHFIRALEAGENGMLPEIPYVISMYRKVAMAVDVDPEPMIQACKAFQEQEGQPRIHQSDPRARDLVQGHDSSSPESRRQSREPSRRREPPKPGAMAASQQKRRADRGKGAGKSDRVIILVGCGVGLALVGAVQLANELGPAIRSRLVTSDTAVEEVETGTEAKDQASDVPAIQQQPIPDIADTPLVSPDGPLEELESGEPEPGTVRFIFIADVNDDRSSWIRIEDARGVTLFESVPEPFTSMDLPVTAGVRVRVGRPGLVRWQQPGQPPQPLPQNQENDWIELIPGPVAGQAAPTPLETAPIPLEASPPEDDNPAAPAPEAP